ncbi:MAG TPA: hypothetical protein VEB86_16025 [Chryseosolibacter sp.]|nr:hypothetical protein [Chryseosolibacter sp.]
MKTRLIMLVIVALWPAVPRAQETVFGLLKNDLQHANEYFASKNYYPALGLYLRVAKKDPGHSVVYLRIARCHFYLKEYSQAIEAYDTYRRRENTLPAEDLFLCAEALTSTGRYADAIARYKEYLQFRPEDQIAFKKIWRLTNIHYLYEDSLHFAMRPVGFNTSYGELCAVPFRSGVMFLSDRKELQMVEKLDGGTNRPFYRIYYSRTTEDSTGVVVFDKPFVVREQVGSRYHAGPFSFYDGGSKVVFAANANGKADEALTLQLYFAEERSGKWLLTSTFPYNNNAYSISDPTITADGKVLFFSSDMRGGFGGKDIYRSELLNGKWTKPQNLGDIVNTAFDEVFPYIHHGKTLYFSSNGHAGMGGLDIFKTELTPSGFQEPQNAGYPLNSHADDFGIVLDSLHTHGYISSNRRSGGFDDDIYEFDMDLQTYPVQLSGKIRFKEHSWSDSSTLQVLANARLLVIDHDRNIQVHEAHSNGDGNFSITIPYFSKYKIRVIGEDREEHIVSLEIPKHRKNYSTYEIVIVKDAFKSAEIHVVK